MTERLGRQSINLDLLDAIDGLPREPIDIVVWRAVREGRDPAQGFASHSRWCDGTFEVLYTALDRDGAIAEIDALLSLQPVRPSKIDWIVYPLRIVADASLRLPDLSALRPFGIDTDRYRDRNYVKTQAVAAAAYFLGFNAMLVPSARWSCLNCIAFTESDVLPVVEQAGRGERIDWNHWQRS